jgi:hypothetical protein
MKPSMTEEQAGNHPLLQEFKDSYIIGEEKLTQKEPNYREHNHWPPATHQT